jgi:hypothetical protein
MHKLYIYYLSTILFSSIVTQTIWMNLFKSNKFKKQYLCRREIGTVRIFSKGIVLITSTTIGCLLLSGIINDAAGQMPYLNSNMASVAVGENATASVFCNDGDGMISGGYSTDFSAVQSTFDAMIYSNHPTQEINQSGYFEGWEAGLVNKGNATAKITATVLCLNLTLTP